MRNNPGLTVVVVLAVSLLAGLLPGAHPTLVEQRTIFPIADASVQQDAGVTQWGKSDFLYVENDQYENFISFLRFDLSAFSGVASIESASLELQVRTESVLGSTHVSVHFCPDDSWNENGITWETKPSFDPDLLQSVLVVPSQDGQIQIHSWIVTSVCRTVLEESDKTVSFAMSAEKRTDSSKTYAGFYSRETGYKPRLVVLYTGVSTQQQPNEDASLMLPLVFASIAIIAVLAISTYALKRHRSLSVRAQKIKDFTLKSEDSSTKRKSKREYLSDSLTYGQFRSLNEFCPPYLTLGGPR